MKRDSPAGAMASPSKKTCILMDKLELGKVQHINCSNTYVRTTTGSPHIGRSSSSGGAQSESSKTGRKIFKPLHLPPTPPSILSSDQQDTKNVRSYSLASKPNLAPSFFSKTDATKSACGETDKLLDTSQGSSLEDMAVSPKKTSLQGPNNSSCQSGSPSEASADSLAPS